MTILICLSCGKKKKIREEKAWLCCTCGGDMWWEGSSKHFLSQHKPIIPPNKGDADYYSKGWFRRNEKEWVSNIKNRKYLLDGKVAHLNDKGERVF